MKKVGLRVDVDTWRGTRLGVPALLEQFSLHQLQASFFFSVGPDNMGRHIWRLLKPHFFHKMVRSRAASLYGWDILLAGTAWPGRHIGRGQADIIRATADHHEVGLHAWDHFAWQTWAGVWSEKRLAQEIGRGRQMLEALTGDAVTCSAVAGWRADSRIIAAKEPFHFRYNSDCRGSGPFIPLLPDGTEGTVQIPVTLPTWDEVVGQQVSAARFNDFILERMQHAAGTAVYTIHAEVEGIAARDAFSNLLDRARQAGIHFCPLSELLPADLSTLPRAPVIRGRIAGREGWLGCQAEN